ncbi:MAG: UDP-N-acetylglucosamine 1-carboxyvinyltransferase [Christensenellales bacterium]
MDKLVINGGQALYGEVKIQGAKNAILPLFAAAVLTEEKVVITNVPDLADVDNMIKILKNLGVKVERYGSCAVIDASVISDCEIPNNLAKELRSSVFLLGSVLSRCGKAKVAYPGGCDIGLRPIDIHIKALRDLNVEVEESKGYIFCDAKNFQSNEINLDYPSVGATENVILCSAISEGTTVLHNAACEPEIVDLQNFLVRMGAKIVGAGTSVIKIHGVKSLHGTQYDAMPDRIVAGTYAIAVAMNGGAVRLNGARISDMRALLSKLSKTSCNIIQDGGSIYIKSNGKPISVPRVTTQPHPGFPTDLQAPMMALQTVSDGVSIFTENIFENRFRHVGELIKMGADIVINGRTAVVKGVNILTGTDVYAQDLRGGAALVLAGLKAEGVTTVHGVHYIDRGYEKIEEVFRSLGADIRRE